MFEARTGPLEREAVRCSDRGASGLAAYTVDGGRQVEVQLLDREPEYVHVAVAVDGGGWTAIAPLTASFLVYRDGRIEKPAL